MSDILLDASERRKYIRIARDFFYSEEVIERLKQAKTDTEASNIMCDARKGKYGRTYND